MYQSGKHTVRWIPPLCEVYSTVSYTNGEENGCHQGQIANMTVPTWSMSIFWQQSPDMREQPMGILLYIVGSITDHDHLKMNVVCRYWLRPYFDNETS